jgi:hypothetical protein
MAPSADDCVVPIQSRCPSCQAALTPRATWCSLCHADLRPAPAPLVDTTPVLVEAAEPVDLRPDSSPQAAAPRRGRHARPDDDPGAPVVEPTYAAPGGRHRRSAVALLDADDVQEPQSPEDVGVYADLMLTRLALADPTPRLADPSRFPGGRWGLAGAATVAVMLVVLAGTALLGVILG